MKIRRKSRHGAEVPTHSLNDIMFFLLLFFLIMATFANPNMMKILTARGGDGTPVPSDKKWDVKVTVEKEIFYNEKKVSPEELESILLAQSRVDTTMLVALDVAADADVQQLVDIMSLCAKCQVKHYLKDPR